MRHWSFLSALLFVLLFVPLFLNSSNAAVILNEIYPAPPAGEYEWIELYNNEDKSIDISQYQLLDADGHKIKISTESAPSFGFVLATSSAVLNNSGDTVFLKNSIGEIVEIATYSGGFDSTKVFTKCSNMGWFILGETTKNISNETACLILTPVPTPTAVFIPTETPTTIPTAAPTNSPTTTPSVDYDSVFISEVYPYPNKDEEEWVELYNSSENEVVLTDWKIDDIENGGSSPHTFSLTIPAKQYGTVSFSSSLFNNTGDSVRLLSFLGNEKDSMEYIKAKQGLSFGRQNSDSDTYCIQSPSQNSINNDCNEEKQTTSQTQTKTTTSPVTKIVKTVTPLLVSTKNINSTVYAQKTNAEVLGETTQFVSQSSPPSLSPYLSIVSISYALLTLASVFVKMKYAINP